MFRRRLAVGGGVRHGCHQIIGERLVAGDFLIYM